MDHLLVIFGYDFPLESNSLKSNLNMSFCAGLLKSTYRDVFPNMAVSHNHN